MLPLKQLGHSEPLPSLPLPIKIKNNLDLRFMFRNLFFKIWKLCCIYEENKNQNWDQTSYKKTVKVIFLVLKSTRICWTKIKNRTSYPSVVIIEVVTFFFNSPPTPLMFVQGNQQLYHYFFLPSLTWRTPFLTVPAVHLNFTTTFGLCCEDCYEEKSDQLKLALNI